ncbi:MAG: PAS domain-containing protein [Methylophilaceae bacterium]|nr:PAS domain-containing protein [Methylophilaceae bacterium]
MTAGADEHLNALPDHDYWRVMRVSNLYRLVIAGVFVGSHVFLNNIPWWENYDSQLYAKLAIGYFIFSALAITLTRLRWPAFDLQRSFQAIADIAFIVALMHAAGGVASGLGLLLVVAIAAASLVSQGRWALFYAAIASIALLLEQSFQILNGSNISGDYSHSVMLSLSCFATAWLAHSFAVQTHQSEALASQRGVDLENLAQVNALITQEMQDGVLVVDKDFKLRHHNVQAEYLLALDQHTFETQALAECVPELVDLLRNWINERDDIEPTSIQLAKNERELRLRFMPVGSNRQQGAVIFIEDWSQLRAQSQQLKLAALGRLTAHIAHEIRNPLSAISHANQLLQEDETHDLASHRLLQIIADNVQRLDRIVKDVLELNRRDRTKQEIIVLEDFLQEFHDQFCQVERITPLGFRLEINPSPASSSVQILFDRRHLNQILWNLCRNGWHHSQQQAASLILSLHVQSDIHSLRLEIMDDGLGVPVEAQSHLFEPFFTTEATGTGLGLYIARELCEANGASLNYTPAETGGLFIIHLKKA